MHLTVFYNFPSYFQSFISNKWDFFQNNIVPYPFPRHSLLGVKLTIMQFSVFELSIFCFSSASERLLEMLGTVVAYVDDVLVSLFGFLFLLLWWYQWGLNDIFAFSTPSKIPLQVLKKSHENSFFFVPQRIFRQLHSWAQVLFEWLALTQGQILIWVSLFLCSKAFLG